MRQFVAIFFFVSCLFVGTALQAEFYGTVLTGLQVIEKKYPYYLYIPREYSQEKDWPLLILLSDRGEEPKELIGRWVDWAESRDILVTAVPNLASGRENPQKADDWLLRVKRDLTEKYRIDSRRVLLVGFGFGAHYAAYLAMNYPREFSYAVLIGGLWEGPFAKLMRPTTRRRNQVSFFIAVDPQVTDANTIEKQVVNLEEKGYRIVRTPFEPEKEISELGDQIMHWFHREAQEKDRAQQMADFGWKKRVTKIIEDFFEV